MTDISSRSVTLDAIIQRSPLFREMYAHVEEVPVSSYYTYRPKCMYMIIEGRVTKNDITDWVLTKLSRKCLSIATLVDTSLDSTYTHACIDMPTTVYLSCLVKETFNGMRFHIGKLRSSSKKKIIYTFFEENTTHATTIQEIAISQTTASTEIQALLKKISFLEAENRKAEDREVILLERIEEYECETRKNVMHYMKRSDVTANHKYEKLKLFAYEMIPKNVMPGVIYKSSKDKVWEVMESLRDQMTEVVDSHSLAMKKVKDADYSTETDALYEALLKFKDNVKEMLPKSHQSTAEVARQVSQSDYKLRSCVTSEALNFSLDECEDVLKHTDNTLNYHIANRDNFIHKYGFDFVSLLEMRRDERRKFNELCDLLEKMIHINLNLMKDNQKARDRCDMFRRRCREYEKRLEVAS